MILIANSSSTRPSRMKCGLRTSHCGFPFASYTSAMVSRFGGGAGTSGKGKKMPFESHWQNRKSEREREKTELADFERYNASTWQVGLEKV